eukprot:CAMPEP_0185036160 /NCGR_PEP_ID=MMETSP1103-20130426/28715_1 /TAXON_ID=36769 /ORGANISM="Paraphysomonas bandaiensis, Strain Caron Lab Isolate" /LENGTH=108 /DNA_ID=CAMNT_0027573583 /DNA_START=18 /DNA_END=344 /DNA_ORIENTATION=+
MKRLFTLLMLMVWCVAVYGKKRGTGVDRAWKNKRLQCEKFECSYTVLDEAMNCINNCTSPMCYQEVYGSSPLEDGEVDDKRNRLFTACLRKESKNMKRNKPSASSDKT